ncbi:MAG: Blp family class II bacteriocin [Streptococcaceae bacterium]|jgi:hypothetical protein|nr:Blp family class II bacteriocin [Streptococcaceae bacterium]
MLAQTMNLNTDFFAQLEVVNDEQLMEIVGGNWSWKAFGQSTVGGAVGGAVAGAAGGTMTLPVVGTVAGWAGGGILGGVGGAAAYTVAGWW